MASLASDNPFACGPVLLQPGAESILVVVDHSTAVPARLEYRRADGTGPLVTVDSPPKRHHAFSLTGLAPATEYLYRVRRGTGDSTAEATFRTLADSPSAFRFVVMGDHRSQPDQWARVAQTIQRNEPTAVFAVGTGDYPADGRRYGEWVEQFYEPGRQLLSRLPLWPCIGNHERTRQRDGSLVDDAPYFSLFDLPGNELWYRFDHGPATFLVLDSNTTLEPEGDQCRWLEEQLASPRRTFTFVFLHHSPFSSGPHTKLGPNGQPSEWPVDHARRYLAPRMERAGVDIVFSGHDHIYEQSQKDGVTYVVTGGAGAPLYEVDSVPNPHQKVAVAAHHYVAVDVRADAVAFTAIDVDGHVLDQFERRARSESLVR